MTDKISVIKQRITVPELCDKLGIRVNRSGFAYSVLHSEKTPSMKIYQNGFHDFSTGKGGDVIDLYAAATGSDKTSSIRTLYELAGGAVINVKRTGTPSPAVHSYDHTPYEAMDTGEREYYDERLGMGADADQVLRFIQLNRLQTENIPVLNEFISYLQSKMTATGMGMQYLLSRGFTEQTIKRFRLCAIGNYSEVNAHMKKQFPVDRLQRVGLFNKREDGSGNLIFFKHRVIIPYLHEGNCVYIRGRYFDESGNSQTDGMKYLGLKDDGLKVNTVKRFYNTDVIRQSYPGEKVYITEGEFDAIAVEQMGYNALAVPGAGAMPDDFSRIKNKGLKVVLLTDNDQAGQGLKEKLMERCWRFGIEVFEKILPAKDANEYLLNG